MRSKMKRCVLVAIGVVVLANTAPVSQARDGAQRDYVHQGGVPKRGPSSVWRLVQQPTSLGISPCAQYYIDARASGLRPLYIPYHGWREKQAGKVGYAPSQWSTLGGPMVNGGVPYFGLQNGSEGLSGGCPTCAPGPGMATEGNMGTLLPPPSVLEPFSTETPTEGDIVTMSARKTQLPTSEIPIDAPADVLAGPMIGNSQPEVIIGTPFQTSTVDNTFATLDGQPNGGLITTIKPGTAQLIIDCPPEMSLSLYRTHNMNDFPSRLQSSGSRRIVECTGLNEEGTFGYMLRGDLGKQPLQVEHVTTYDSYPTVPRVFEPQDKPGLAWVGVKSGDRVHVRFASMQTPSGPPIALAPGGFGTLGPAVALSTSALGATSAPSAFTYTWKEFPNRIAETNNVIYAQVGYDNTTFTNPVDPQAILLTSFTLIPQMINGKPILPALVNPTRLTLIAKTTAADVVQPLDAELVAEVKFKTKNVVALQNGPKLEPSPKIMVTFTPVASPMEETEFSFDLGSPEGRSLQSELENQIQRSRITSTDPLESVELQFSLKYGQTGRYLYVPVSPHIVIKVIP